MCTFMSSLPSNSATAESAKKKNLALFIRPSKEKEYYRFRLLAFKSPTKNNRDYPFIERYIHQHWTTNPETNKKMIDGQVVCPVTKFVHTEGNPYDECPICRYANMNFLSWKESNWKDKESAKKNREFGRKFEAIIPVYVRNDPNYPQNNGKFKVLIFSDKEFYKSFQKLIRETSMKACCFNNKNAVDFYIHMTEVPKVVNEGLPTQYTFNERVIDKFGFTKPEKACDIPAITKEAIDNFEFDETYYVSSTPDELQAFYDKFIKISNDDIPDDDEVPVYEAPKKEVITKTNKVVETVMENTEITQNVDDTELDDLMTDTDDLPAVNATSAKSDDIANVSDDEDLFDGLDLD